MSTKKSRWGRGRSEQEKPCTYPIIHSNRNIDIRLSRVDDIMLLCASVLYMLIISLCCSSYASCFLPACCSPCPFTVNVSVTFAPGRYGSTLLIRKAHPRQGLNNCRLLVLWSEHSDLAKASLLTVLSSAHWCKREIDGYSYRSYRANETWDWIIGLYRCYCMRPLASTMKSVC